MVVSRDIRGTYVLCSTGEVYVVREEVRGGHRTGFSTQTIRFYSAMAMAIPEFYVWTLARPSLQLGLQPITPDDDARKQESYSEPSPTIYLIDR